MDKKQNKLLGLRDAINYSSEPTRHFEIGSHVSVGYLKNAIVKDVFKDGKVYLIEFESDEGETVRKCFIWHEIYSEYDGEASHGLIKNNDEKINYSQRTLDALLNIVYYYGANLNPSYQRGYEWDEKDKISLIDSIFHNVDIGKFVFVNPLYNDDDPRYEILDGKQRLKAITDYYEGKFPYKGFYFNDLSPQERRFFQKYNISYAELYNPTEGQKLKTFILLNTRGRDIESSHIEKVRNMYKQLTGSELE